MGHLGSKTRSVGQIVGNPFTLYHISNFRKMALFTEVYPCSNSNCSNFIKDGYFRWKLGICVYWVTGSHKQAMECK